VTIITFIAVNIMFINLVILILALVVKSNISEIDELSTEVNKWIKIEDD